MPPSRRHILALTLLMLSISHPARAGEELAGNLTGAGGQGLVPVGISVDPFTGVASGALKVTVPPGSH